MIQKVKDKAKVWDERMKKYAFYRTVAKDAALTIAATGSVGGGLVKYILSYAGLDHIPGATPEAQEDASSREVAPKLLSKGSEGKGSQGKGQADTSQDISVSTPGGEQLAYEGSPSHGPSIVDLVMYYGPHGMWGAFLTALAVIVTKRLKNKMKKPTSGEPNGE